MQFYKPKAEALQKGSYFLLKANCFPQLWNLDFATWKIFFHTPLKGGPFKIAGSVVTAILDTYGASEIVKFTGFYETCWQLYVIGPHFF